MLINLEVNNRQIQAQSGETILSALNRNGIRVPTICSMESFSPTGACRMCVVEAEGHEHLITACSYPVEEGMKLRTHSPRVLKARKTNVELLLSNHPDDCLYCERNGNCELQHLAEDLNVRERRIPGHKSQYKVDKSSPAIFHDPAKCILCGRCIRVCEETTGISAIDFTYRGSNLQVMAAMAKPLNFSSCISCGQCVMACPTGALTEKVQFHELDGSLHDPDKVVVLQYTTAVAVSIAEEFHLKPGSDLKGLINAALRKCGFAYIFETAFGADVAIMEQAALFADGVERDGKFPVFTSSCPAWVRYVEQFRPDLLSYLSPVRSPQQITGSLIRRWFSEKAGIPADRIYSVAVTSCTAAKSEAQRVEMTWKGIQDIDSVLTTRELARLIRLNGIDLNHLEPEPADAPLIAGDSAGKLFYVAGGEAEATIRTIHRQITGDELPVIRLNKFRGARILKETSILTGKKVVQMAAVSGLANAIRLIEEIQAGKRHYDFVEVMACPDGCINGGGQPLPSDENQVRVRMKTIYDIDNKAAIKVAHKSPTINRLYEEFLEKPGSGKARNMLHTVYSEKEILK
ncbi:MAG: [Fe-Fe] hydrogenase large subunit C-terminal domain-containing protein [Bacteroidota bacterium]